MGNPGRRSDKYAAKVTPDRVSSDWTKRVGAMKTNATATQNAMVQMEDAVRTVLNGAGVATITYPFYLNFGREIFALKRRGVEGESLAEEVAVLLAKWVAQGLVQAVLEAVRSDVFSVQAPVGP